MRDTGAAPSPGEAEIDRIFRAESLVGRWLPIRIFGDIDVAEDAVQEAFTIAASKWPGDGLPPNPGGWITTTARNRAIDRLRRESRGRELLSEATVLSPGNGDPGLPGEAGPVQDDRLRLMFTCCHPALSTQAQVALTLRLLGGLSTREVARSFLVTEQTMAVRLVRAKRKIKAARIPYRVPGDHELPGRLPPVLAVVYLIYTAGLTSPAGPGLGAEAIRLARILATLMPDEPEVAGLLALLLLTESRRASRTRPDGSLVLLGEQDRSQWDRALIEEGQAIVRRACAATSPAPTSSRPPSTPCTRTLRQPRRPTGRRVAALYDQLLTVAPTPVVALNRAIAIGEVQGPAAALALADELDLDNYHLFDATRADLLYRLGRDSEATAAGPRTRGQHGTDPRRAGVPQARRPGLALMGGAGPPSLLGESRESAARGPGLPHGDASRVADRRPAWRGWVLPQSQHVMLELHICAVTSYR